MENIILIGGGGHCKSVIDVIEQENKYKIIGIVDKKSLVGSSVLGYEIIGSDEDLQKIFLYCTNALVSVGHIDSPKIRKKLFKQLKEIGFKLPVIISPLAYLSKHAEVSEGTILMHYSVVNANARIGKNCILNTKSLIEHDALIHDHCHISTAAVINGGVTVNEGSFFGSNATTKEKINVSGFIKAGSVQT